MTLRFSVLCHLLCKLEAIASRDPPLLPGDSIAQQTNEIEIWFRAHRRAIDSLDAAEAISLLSALLPERRVDRVYGMQSAGLARHLCRTLRLTTTKSMDVYAFREPGHGDLADCLERVLDGRGAALPVVTVLEVNRMLDLLAARNRFSNPDLRYDETLGGDGLAAMSNIIQRLHGMEAKWLVRLILKNLSPVHLDEILILSSVHFLLPDILRVQQDFTAAIATLRGPFRKYPSCPDAQSAALLRQLVSSSIRPHVGTKVSRSTFCKARSIDHCLQITNKKRWMMERKYDGEFCEIHIDLSKEDDWLRIFSKSGKDSTKDRKEIKQTLKRILSINSPACKIQDKCILLAEMVVYSDKEKQIMPFHKIRKYISRSGTYIGAAKDSPRRSHEHLMVVLFDILLLDDRNVMQRPAEERKTVLQNVCKTKAGRAMVAESRVLDFAEPDAKHKLMKQFAASIAARHEGLVLKPCTGSYLSMGKEGPGQTSVMIKLKKDYINGLGDEADIAVIGASSDPQLVAAKQLAPKTYTHFYLGCLANPTEVERWSARPCYKVLGSVSADSCIPPSVLSRANELAKLVVEPYERGSPPSMFDVVNEAETMSAALKVPLVFEVLGSSYEKPSNCDYWMLRHPRVKKLHEDRSWSDCVSFAALQQQAKEALSAPIDSESQENLRWMDRIEQSCRRKMVRASAQTTPASKARTSPTSARVARDGSERQSACPRKPLAPRENTNSLPTPPTSSALEPTKRLAEEERGSPSPKRQRMNREVEIPLVSTNSKPQDFPADVHSRIAEYLGTLREDECSERNSARRILAARTYWHNIPHTTVPTPGRCAFVAQSTSERVVACPLSRAAVFIDCSSDLPADSRHMALVATLEAELHGAAVVRDLPALGAAEPYAGFGAGPQHNTRRVFHVQAESGTGQLSGRLISAAQQVEALWVGERFTTMRCNAIEFLDITAVVEACKAQSPSAETDVVSTALHESWGRMTLGTMCHDGAKRQATLSWAL